MTGVGYSGTPLWKKLGFREGTRARFLYAPERFNELLEGAPAWVLAEGSEADVIVLFVIEASVLVEQLDEAIRLLADRGGLWIAWPKKASKVPTDITEDLLRDLILPTGLVDNKVCAITDIWSGLRFVRRVKQALGG